MDNKTRPHADEKSAYHLNPLASKSQAQGVPKGELVAKERESAEDEASKIARNRRRM